MLNKTYEMADNEIIEYNVKFAKKYMVESIYRSANVEGIGVTFPETQVICDGMSVAGHSVDDINAIVDLKKAWQWIFSNCSTEITIETIKTINRVLGKYTVINAGSIRDGYDEPIRVSLKNGKYYYPPYISDIEDVSEDIKNILSSNDAIDTTLEIFCYLCKKQLFNDGNKRTATLISNLYMIQKGLGILSIPDEYKIEFFNYLTDYYENDDAKPYLKEFLKSECLTLSKYGKEIESINEHKKRIGKILEYEDEEPRIKN